MENNRTSDTAKYTVKKFIDIAAPIRDVTYQTLLGRNNLYVTSLSLQRQNAENLKQMFPEKEYRGLSPNFHIHVSVSDLYIPTMGLPVLLE
jgi:hypothetical protein